MHEEDWEAEVVSETIQHLSAHSPNLRRMKLEYIELDFPLEDYPLILSGAGFLQLEELMLINTNINDEALLAAGISGGLPSLKKLTLDGCE